MSDYCPLNLKCEGLGEFFEEPGKSAPLERILCWNYRTCKELGYSWEIPYKYDFEEKCLEVICSPGVIDDKGERRWYDDREFCDRVQEGWKKAGWAIILKLVFGFE